MNVEEFENERWQNFDQKPVFRHRAALNMVPPGSVLDLGCGDGLFLEMLQRKGFEAEGLDASSEAVKKCIAKGLKAQVYDFTHKPLPYEDNSFDSVVLLDVLEHTYSPEPMLCEAARVAKTCVIASVPNFNSLPARLQVLRGHVPENNQPWKGHVYWFNYSALKRLFAKCDLEVETIEKNTFWQSKPVSGMLARIVAGIFPGLGSLSFVIKGGKNQASLARPE